MSRERSLKCSRQREAALGMFNDHSGAYLLDRSDVDTSLAVLSSKHIPVHFFKVLRQKGVHPPVSAPKRGTPRKRMDSLQ